MQGSEHLFPAPLLWIAMWSLPPALAVIGVWMSRRPRIRLVALALLVELTGIISLGGGIVFAFVIEPVFARDTRRVAPCPVADGIIHILRWGVAKRC